jgi:hypothetical protein
MKTNMVPGGWNSDCFSSLLLTLSLMLHACDEFQPTPTYGFFLIAKIHYFSYLNMGLASFFNFFN